jgi:diacylglycerol O-acyltransferase
MRAGGSRPLTPINAATIAIQHAARTMARSSQHATRRHAPRPAVVRLPPLTAERMSAVDHAWLEMDQPDNPMIVSALLTLDEVRAPKQVMRQLVTRLLEHPRFRQRADTSHHTARWVDDGELNLAYHVRLDHGAHDASEHRLAALIGAELSQPLDRAMPLWRVTVYPRLHRRLTILFRAHHAIADGVAQLRLLLALADPSSAGPRARRIAAAADRRHGPLATLIERLDSANLALERIGAQLREELRHPDHLVDELRQGLGIARSVARVLRTPRRVPLCFTHALSGRRQVAWRDDISLARVRRFAHQHGVSVNDVFLTALATAFDHHLTEHGAAPSPGNELGISIPVNLRAEHDGDSGNSFGLVLLGLPAAEPDWRRRLSQVASRMADLKRSPEAYAVLAGLDAVGHLPPAAEKRIVNWIGDKACAVVSNLPGPRRRLRFGGARVGHIVFWPPQTSHVGIGVSLLSYAGTISIGVSSDAALIPEPRRFVDAIVTELTCMLAARTPRHGRARA